MAESQKDRTIIERAMKCFRQVNDAESDNRAKGLNALRFSLGDQWDTVTMNSRQLESRPYLTINKVDAFCRQVSNQQRQQRPRIKVHAVNDIADVKIADIIAGICRHVEVNSNADTAYDTAFDHALRIGWGYWRIVTNYTKETSFDQDIYIQTVDNPFSVYFDPNSTLPDGSDAEFCIITDMVPRDTFKRLYPNADDGSAWTEATIGDTYAEWVDKDSIRIAEYFYVDRKAGVLCLLSDKSTAWEDELPPEETLAQFSITIVSRRKSFKKTVKWCKLTAMEELESKDWAGRFIPVIPMYGNRIVVDGKVKKYGLVENAMDPQRMYNFWRSAMTESVALAPKAKWLLAAGQDEGFEQEWNQANIAARPVLHYNQTDVDGQQAPAPQRLQPEPPPQGAMESALAISQDLTSVLGIVDPAERIGGNVSGKALKAEHAQADNSNFHYYDNMTRSISHTGKIILDLIPKIYDQERMLRIIGEDGRPDMVVVNQHSEDPMGKIINDVTIGEYDVVMDTGPGYNSKRLEAVDAMMPLMAGNEDLFKVAGDLVFRNMDFPGADTIADRLAAANPLAQIDEKLDIPPPIQMKLKQQEQQIQQMTQALQAAQLEIKHRGSIVQMQEDAKTQREHMIQATKAHDIEMRDNTKLQANREDNAAWMHDVASKQHTALSVAEINAVKELLKSKMTNEHEISKIENMADREEKEIADI